MLLASLLSAEAFSAVDYPQLNQVNGHGMPGMYLGTARVADVDGDGLPDVLMAGSFKGGDEFRVFRNISAGGLIRFEMIQSSAMGSDGGGHLEVGDYDADGDIDFVSTFVSHHVTYIGTNDGNGHFDVTTLEYGGRHIAFADLDKDGRLEIISTRLSAPLQTSWNGTAWVAKQTGYLNDICDGGIAVGDFSGNGWPDIVVGGNCSGFGNQQNTEFLTYSHWFQNVGGIVEADASGCLSSLGTGGLASCDNGMDNGSYVVDDFDRDGAMDIAFAGSHEGFDGPPGVDWIHYDFAVMLNKGGTGQNWQLTQYAEGGAANVNINGISSGDINGDGYPDIFFMGHRRDGDYTFESRLYVNDQSGGMTQAPISLPKLGRGNGAIADFDGDGRFDLLYHGAEIPWHPNSPSTSSDSNTINTIKTYIYRNAGEGTSPNPPSALTVEDPES